MRILESETENLSSNIKYIYLYVIYLVKVMSAYTPLVAHQVGVSVPVAAAQSNSISAPLGCDARPLQGYPQH